MLQHILLVAAREFRQIAMTRSFWITLLILPLAFALGPLASRFIDKSDTETVMLVDQSGGAAGAAIRQRITLDEQRAVLDSLARYVRRHDLQRAAPDALWAQQDRWYSDADVARFIADGGAEGARKLIARVSKADADLQHEAVRFHVGPEAPVVHHFLALDLDHDRGAVPGAAA